jgi:LysM repeat protein
VEGNGQITTGDTTMSIPAGAWASVPLDENGLPNGTPEGPLPYNNLDMQSLPVSLLGDQIAIAPALRPEGFVAELSFPLLHEVQPGETLFRIALQYNLPYALVAAANGITNPDLVFVGQVLVIPPPDFPINVPPLPIPEDEISTDPEIVTDLPPQQPIGIVNGYTPQGGSPEDNECNPGGTMAGQCVNDEHQICGWMMARYNRGIITLDQVLPETCRPPVLPPPEPDLICTTDSLGITTCVAP